MTGKSATPCENGLHLICLYVLKTEVFPVEAPVALAWGDLMALGKRNGRGLTSMDGLIAATAIAHQLTLATRNTEDVEGLDVDILHPWAD